MRLIGWTSGLFVLAALWGSACSDSGDDTNAGTSGTSGGGTSSGGTSGGGTSGGMSSGGEDAGQDATSGTITVTSSAFQAGGSIPAEHSCDGEGESIPLAWTGAPEETQSYAVVMRDKTFENGGDNYHWVIWDIPASTTSLEQGIANDAEPDPPGGGAKQAKWSFGDEIGYGNMCPTEGPPTHTYELTVLAFSTATVPVGDVQSPREIDAILQENKIASGSIEGTYTKP